MRLESLVAAADRAGLFSILAQPRTPASVIAELGLVEHRARWLLAALAADSVLERHGAELVVRGSRFAPAPGGELLATLLRRREPLTWLEVAGNVDAAALLGARELTSIHARSGELADLIAPFADGGTFLDAGCGGGEVAFAVLDRAPHARAVLCDSPDVLRAASAAHPRATTLPGDLRTATLPRCRAIVLANVLHTVSEHDARVIVTRLARSLEPDGRLLIQEVACDDELASGVALRFALSLSLCDLAIPTTATIERWIADAGLAPIARCGLSSAPEAVVMQGDA